MIPFMSEKPTFSTPTSGAFSEPVIRLSTMKFEESSALMMEVDVNASDFEPELPLIAHSDLSLPLVKEPSPVIFAMESITESRSPARRTAG